MTTPHLHLSGTGWRPWSGIRQVLDGCTCLWVDLHGVHLEPAPLDHPVGATHLWGWREHAWIRARLDSGQATAAMLRPEPTDESEPVPVRRHAGQPWGLDYQRTAPWAHPVTLLIVDTPVPLSFVHSVRTTAPEPSTPAADRG